jgi:hypothetical protein
LPAGISTNARGSPTAIRRCCTSDKFGRDVQWIEYHPAYRELEKAAFGEFGIHACRYARASWLALTNILLWRNTPLRSCSTRPSSVSLPDQYHRRLCAKLLANFGSGGRH